MAYQLCKNRFYLPKKSTAYKFACYNDYARLSTPGGIIRVPLNNPNVIGVAHSRGNRSHQEDFYAFATLTLDPDELRLSIKKSFAMHWDPSQLPNSLAGQATFVGIYDGHGGSAVSQYLRQELHGLFESVNKSDIPELYLWVKELGGYFKRFNGGVLQPWINGTENTPKLDLHARATQAFLEADRHISGGAIAKECGATASVAILHSLDSPATPFFSAQRLALTVAHCGDTRVLLCATQGGTVFPMTENHHADARGESQRLRRMMSSLITDSFGESRWMGVLANTRGLGDLEFKKFGVTAEPELCTKLLQGQEWAYIVLVSDGISSVLSDAEVVDLARNASCPGEAAQRVLSFAEELSGGEDNATVLVVPLAGWGKVKGPDKTKDLREYKRRQAEGTERQRLM